MITVVSQYNMIVPILALGVGLCLIGILYSRFRLRCILLLIASSAMGFYYSIVSLCSCLIAHGRPNKAFVEAMSWWYAVGTTLEIVAVIWCIMILLRKNIYSSLCRFSAETRMADHSSPQVTSATLPICLVLVVVGGFMVLALVMIPTQRGHDVSNSEEMSRAVFYDISAALQAYKTQHGILPSSLADLQITNLPCGASTSWLSRYEYSCEAYSNSQGQSQKFRLDRRTGNKVTGY